MQCTIFNGTYLVEDICSDDWITLNAYVLAISQLEYFMQDFFIRQTFGSLRCFYLFSFNLTIQLDFAHREAIINRLLLPLYNHAV